jgi:predicted small lipoprotein YifL
MAQTSQEPMQMQRNLRSRIKESTMKRFTSVAAAAIVAANLAACGPHGPAEQTVARQNPVPPAEAAKPAGEFSSAVTPNPTPAPASVADTELSGKVKSALTSTKGLDIGGVDVEAANGVVTLYGTVDAPAEKDRAAILAMEVDGVRSVVNNLVVIRGS